MPSRNPTSWMWRRPAICWSRPSACIGSSSNWPRPGGRRCVERRGRVRDEREFIIIVALRASRPNASKSRWVGRAPVRADRGIQFAGTRARCGGSRSVGYSSGASVPDVPFEAATRAFVDGC